MNYLDINKYHYTLGIGEAEVWTEDSEGYSDFQIVTEIWVEPQCGYVQMPTQSTAIYMHPLQYHQLHDAVSTIFILQLLIKILFLFMCVVICYVHIFIYLYLHQNVDQNV